LFLINCIKQEAFAFTKQKTAGALQLQKLTFPQNQLTRYACNTETAKSVRKTNKQKMKHIATCNKNNQFSHNTMFIVQENNVTCH